MKKFLKKILPSGLRRRLRALWTGPPPPPPPPPIVIGDLNKAFGVDAEHLFLDGWLAGTGDRIEAVQLRDAQGTLTPAAAFSVYQFARKDVAAEVARSLPGANGFGYRMLVRYPQEAEVPSAVVLQLNDGSSRTQTIRERYSTSLRRIWKIQQLSSTPEHYGVRQPIAKNPTYVQRILAPSRSLLEKQTSFEGTVDALYQCKEGSMLILGWIGDEGIVQGNGQASVVDTNQELPQATLFRYYRPDLKTKPHEMLGMLLFVEAPGITPPQLIRYRTENHGEVLIHVKEKSVKGKALLDLFLQTFEYCKRTIQSGEALYQLSARFIPIIEKLHRELQKHVSVADELRWGAPVVDPEVSIIIPIYKTYALMKHQLADFSIDPFITRQEIILVLDAPEDRNEFLLLMHRLYDLYHVPVRVLIMNRNGGFARACNAGARAAQAPYTLFLNSDVFPKRPGWLESMRSRLQDDASVGAVGAQLLFPDESIQHAGLTWCREASLGHLLINHHPWKGMDPSLLPHRGAAEVPAVTAACLLCRTQEFHTFGLFDEQYIRGDYEDSDFCLRLREHGKRIVCDHDAVLYHVEGNSYPSEDRKKVFFFNAMRHEQRWGKFIAQLTHTHGEPERESDIVA